MSEGTQLSDMAKLAHLLEHWQSHNNDHAGNYREWADKARRDGKTEAAGMLQEAADLTDRITELFAKAKGSMGG